MERARQEKPIPPLWRALARLMRKQRLGIADMVRLSGLSRGAFYKIKNGSRPLPDTIELLARGLATEPDDSTAIDEEFRLAAYEELFRAAGYPPTTVQLDTDDPLAASLVAAFGDDAVAMAEFIHAAPALSEADRRLILDTVAWLRARVGDAPGAPAVRPVADAP